MTPNRKSNRRRRKRMLLLRGKWIRRRGGHPICRLRNKLCCRRTRAFSRPPRCRNLLTPFRRFRSIQQAEAVAAGEIVDEWSGVEAQIRAESVVLARCGDGASACPSAAPRFLAIIAEGRVQTGLARIGVINRAINLAIGPMTDLEQWGEIDRWSPPLETFATGRGDCEDYAIAKYVALRAAGVAGEDVKIVIVRNTAAEETHAVVAVRVDEAWMILDNRWLALVRDREMWRATPLFELDDNGVRRFIEPAPTATLQQARSGAS
jgi:predicted transglutaminase-like cysteine proteinase